MAQRSSFLWLAMVTLGGGLIAQERVTVPLTSRTHRTWTIDLPKPTTIPVGPTLDIPHHGERPFATLPAGTGLEVDTDADGVRDVALTDGESVVVLQGTTVAGRPLRYPIRLSCGASGWVASVAGSRTGELFGRRIRIIDQDLDGRFDGVGRDAMVLGDGNVASFLSSTVQVDGRLFDVEVSSDGTELSATPYTGASGILDLRDGLTASGKMLGVVVASADGRNSFELSESPEGCKVPVGTYRLVKGSFGLGENRVVVHGDAAKPFHVLADQRTAPRWGGQLVGHFTFERSADAITFDPTAVWYFGQAGESYVDWTPLGKSPTFVITDARDRRELVRAQFPGSC